MLSLSSCSLISLGSHFPSSGDRWSSPSMHFQLEEQGRGFRRAKVWGDALLHPLQWLARVTFTKGGLHQPLIASSSAVHAAARCKCVGQRCSVASTTPFVWGELCRGCVELGGQKWESGCGNQDIISARCWDIYLNPSIQQCANSGPFTEVSLRAGPAFPILFLLGWKWERNLPFLFFPPHVHLVNTSARDHSYFVCGVIQ